ncbi:hypothetical protein HY312_00265 [Candidatus Saccharibacteria bacterium]|nr:hypothetical protein [Candidatus Saccharibacteria bacterium]
MSEYTRLITDTIVFEALQGNNVIDEDNMKARQLQDILNNSTDSMEKKAKVATSMITKLDKECHHTDKEVVVSGRIMTREIELSGIEFLNKEDVSIEPEALKTIERTVEDTAAISRGYVAIVNPEEETFTFYQVIETNFYSISVPSHGSNVAQSGKAFVPLDNTSYVSLADFENENIPNNKLLDIYAPDLLDAIDEILDSIEIDPENLNIILKQLSELDIKALCTDIYSDSFAEIRLHIEAYLSILVDYKKHTPYYVSGAKNAYAIQDGKREEVRIRDGQQIPGYLNRIILAEEMRGIAVELVMPFSNGYLYPVQYTIDQDTHLNAMETFPALAADHSS